MEYYTADTYKDCPRIGNPFYNKSGKLATKVKCKCDRCTNGIYAIGVEKGRIKPYPVAGGVCFKCEGVGYEIKEVRLYTESEYKTMQRNKEKSKRKKRKGTRS